MSLKIFFINMSSNLKSWSVSTGLYLQLSAAILPVFEYKKRGEKLTN